VSNIWWSPKVISMPSLELSRTSNGGYQKPSWGQVSFAPDTYEGAPPRKAEVSLDWGLNYSNSIHLFDGTIVLRRYTTQSLDYDIFEKEYEVELLEEGVDTNDDEILRPLVIGRVEHMNPRRTGSETERKYYLPDFEGSIGSGIDAYDDGVLINDNWTDNGDGTISRSVNIVGELTFCGTGNSKTLIDVFEWACNKLEIELNSDNATSDIEIDAVITGQQYVFDFLDKLAFYCDHGFYIQEGVLHLISNDVDNGSQSIGLGEGEFDPINITYEWPQPVKKISTEWQTRYAKVDENGSRIETEDHEIEILSDFSVIGIEQTIGNIYNFDEDKVRTRLNALMDRANRPNISIEIPLYRLPVYGERIDFVDLVNINPATGYVKCRDISLNYDNKAVSIKGDGEVVFT